MSFDLLAMVQNYCAALAVDRLHNRVAGSMDRSSYGIGNIQSGVILHLSRPGRRPHPDTGAYPAFYRPVGRERCDHSLKLPLQSGEDFM